MELISAHIMHQKTILPFKPWTQDVSKIISFCKALERLNKCVWISGAQKKKLDLLHRISRCETLRGLLSLVESSLVDTGTPVMWIVVCLSWLSAGRGSIISFISYICVHDSPATHLPDCHHPPLPLYKPGASCANGLHGFHTELWLRAESKAQNFVNVQIQAGFLCQFPSLWNLSHASASLATSL